MVSLKFLIYIILTAGMFHGGQRRPKRRADLTTFISRLSWNLEASTYWNPLGQ